MRKIFSAKRYILLILIVLFSTNFGFSQNKKKGKSKVKMSMETYYLYQWSDGSANPAEALGLPDGVAEIPLQSWVDAAKEKGIDLSRIAHLLPSSVQVYDGTRSQRVVATGPRIGNVTTFSYENGFGFGFTLDQPILKELDYKSDVITWVTLLSKVGDPKEALRWTIEKEAENTLRNKSFLPRATVFVQYTLSSETARFKKWAPIYSATIRIGWGADGSRRFRLDNDVRTAIDDLINGGPAEGLTDLAIDGLIPSFIEELSIHPQVFYGYLQLNGNIMFPINEHLGVGLKVSGHFHTNFSKGFSPVKGLHFGPVFKMTF